ncbi:putative ribonuclease H1 [Bacteroides coprosuis DSM 18011]|uniref:Ribonuclease H n=2 Tax=Bacteroides TaxID=816 RepID=F3ZQE7_9BACE|nr:viroplasmin family protein [Bacteroides coprosuis]EGJ70525.1 putative ribonuclease H1 [Bacteroides coprosuis DSM 18011]
MKIIGYMAKKQKYYVVWKGVNPGIYTSWTDCQLQINGYEGALYKSFPTLEKAEYAYASSPYDFFQKKTSTNSDPKDLQKQQIPAEVFENSLCVDAACSGNPGPMEYRGVYTATGQQLFHYGPIQGTNNIGEFLALVHGLAYLKQQGWDMPIYSDSRNAISWIKQKKCKTKLERNTKTATVYDLIARAEKWLKSNSYSTPIYKWETEKWGEIPADFGRK